jgi:primosomal protein N'
MHIYTVIPIARGIGKETLTYFGPGNIALGALVTIPLRKKTVHAIVVDIHDVNLSKSEIKSQSYALKKIGKVINQNFLPSEFLESAIETAKFFATTTGAVLQLVVSKQIIDSSEVITKTKKVKKPELPKEQMVIQDNDLERLAHYKGVVRSEFARQSSVYFCLPTIEDIKRTKNFLEKGIEQYTIVLHSELTKKEFKAVIAKLNNEAHPLLIIGTPPFLSILRSDVHTIVIDRENSRSWRTITRPYIDLKIFVQFFAKKNGIKLILGDLVLSVETQWRQKHDEYAELFPLKFRMLSTAQCLLVDMKLPKGKFEENFKILSPELEALIDKTKTESENLFIYCARKGLAPITVCGDCGQVVTCKNCGAPVTLYQKKDENLFLCNKCGTETSSSVRCPHCQSWKLKTLGIGLDGVANEITKRFPDVLLFQMDKESVKTEKKALEIIQKFKNTPGSVLIGTELALTYLTEPIENIAVASIDALFALPDFRIKEKIFYLLISMRSRTEKVFLIQTRNAKEKLFDYALKGNLIDFYRDEISDRERFGYPPFSIFVKFTIEGKRPAIENEANRLKTLFKEFDPILFESTYQSPKGNTVSHLLFKFKPGDWPNTNFLEKTKVLPPQVLIKVDPENLL